MASLRAVAAIVMAAAALWLYLLRPPPAVLLCATASVFASLAWLVMVLRARKRLAQPERHRLILDPDALRLIEGESERRIAWSEVVSIATDEERLVVRIETRGTEPLAIEPRYGGLGVYELEAALRRALEAAS